MMARKIENIFFPPTPRETEGRWLPVRSRDSRNRPPVPISSPSRTTPPWEEGNPREETPVGDLRPFVSLRFAGPRPGGGGPGSREVPVFRDDPLPKRRGCVRGLPRNLRPARGRRHARAGPVADVRRLRRGGDHSCSGRIPLSLDEADLRRPSPHPRGAGAPQGVSAHIGGRGAIRREGMVPPARAGRVPPRDGACAHRVAEEAFGGPSSAPAKGGGAGKG